jgi:hypothetical protein
MSISTTGWMLNQFTEERNHYVRTNSDVERYWAQFAYIAIIPFAIIESVISQALRCLVYCAGDDLQREYNYLSAWANQSAWSLLWTIDCVFMNLCSKRLYTTEQAYINFITRFSCQTFRDRFNQEDQELFAPRPVIDRVKKLLENYEVGESSMQYSTLFESLYRMIPEPTPEEIQNLPDEIATLMGDWENVAKIDKDLRNITERNPRKWTPLNRRFIRMLIFTKNTLLLNNNDDELLNFKSQFGGVFRGCVNRMTTEMERIFFQFAAQPLFEKIKADLLKKSQNNNQDPAFFELIYKMIPKPTKEEINALISYVMTHTGKDNNDPLIVSLSIFTAPYNDLSLDEQNFIKILVYTQRAILNHSDATIQQTQEADFIQTLSQPYLNKNVLDKQRNETLFFKYGVCELLEKANLENLLYDFTEIRRKASDDVMIKVIADRDVATNVNYFAAEEHEAFALPPPPLSEVDTNHRDIANTELREMIIAGFRKHYLSTHTIYEEFHEIICPLNPEDQNFKRFKQADFLEELKKKYFAKAKAAGTLPAGIENPSNFELPEEALDETRWFNPQVEIDFLVEMRFLKKKRHEEQA